MTQLKMLGRITPLSMCFCPGLSGVPVASRFQDLNLSLSIDMNRAKRTPMNHPPTANSFAVLTADRSAAITPNAVRSVVVPTAQSFSVGEVSPSCLPSLFANTPISTKTKGTPTMWKAELDNTFSILLDHVSNLDIIFSS